MPTSTATAIAAQRSANATVCYQPSRVTTEIDGFTYGQISAHRFTYG